MEQKLDVIAVGAHPDDVEIGCGGTVASLVQQGYRVGIIDLTDGEPTPGSPSPDVRIAEAHEAAAVLGVAHRQILGLTNRKLFDSFESRVALATCFRRHRPSIVLGLLGKTPMASPDHWQASQIIDGAVFYSRLSKWDEQFDGVPPHTIDRLAYYSLLHSEVGAPQQHQFVVDIGATLATKMNAIRCYKTQFPPEKAQVLRRAETLAQTIGWSAGFEAGEQLTSTKSLGVKDPVSLLLRT